MKQKIVWMVYYLRIVLDKNVEILNCCHWIVFLCIVGCKALVSQHSQSHFHPAQGDTGAQGGFRSSPRTFHLQSMLSYLSADGKWKVGNLRLPAVSTAKRVHDSINRWTGPIKVLSKWVVRRWSPSTFRTLINRNNR